MQLIEGTLLQEGKYRIEGILGQGGFGITYLGWQTRLNRRVAIKEFFMKEYCNRNADTSHITIGTEGSILILSVYMMCSKKTTQLTM